MSRHDRTERVGAGIVTAAIALLTVLVITQLGRWIGSLTLPQ